MIFLYLSNELGSTASFTTDICKGDCPNMSYALTSAPKLIRSSTFFNSLLIAAKWRGVANILSLYVT